MVIISSISGCLIFTAAAEEVLNRSTMKEPDIEEIDRYSTTIHHQVGTCWLQESRPPSSNYGEYVSLNHTRKVRSNISYYSDLS